jgi:hypothetical protein
MVFCPGSSTLEAKHPQEDTEDTLNGDASHWVASSVLTTPQGIEDFIGLTAFNKVIITDEIAEAAELYVATILAVSSAGLHVEEAIRAPRVHAESFGTPDCWYYDATQGILHIWDYKYGHGIVEPFENWQAINYYAGIIDKLGIPDEFLQVRIHIVQPRAPHYEGPVRTWKTTGGALRNYVNRLHNAAGEALGPNPRYVSGEWCRYCKGRHVCLSSEQAAMYSVDVTNSVASRDLSDEEMGTELAILTRAYKALEYRITGMEAEALARINKGAVIPGRKKGYGRGSMNWTKPKKEIAILGDLMGVDVRKPEEVLTPNQAKDKGLDISLLDVYIDKRSGKARLVKDDNSKTRQIFGGQTV